MEYAKAREQLHHAVESAARGRIASGEDPNEVRQDAEQISVMLAQGAVAGGASQLYFPCRPGNSSENPAKGTADPRSSVAVLSVNYGTSGAQVAADIGRPPAQLLRGA